MNLKRLLRPPPGDLWMDSLFWLAAVLFGIWLMAKHGAFYASGYPSFATWFTGFSLLTALGYWMCQRWVRWLLMSASLGLAVGLTLFVISGQPLNFGKIAGIAASVWAFWRAWKEKIPSREDEGTEVDDEKPLVSLVLLQREPPYLEASIIARLASKAWDADIRAEADSADQSAYGIVVGSEEIPFYMLMYGPGVFLIHNVASPYFDDIDAAVNHCKELRTRAAIREHRAWTSMDLVSLKEESEATRDEAYRMIGRFLAELADETQCLAIFDPASGAIHPFDPETEQKLRSNDPLGALREWFYSPIMRVEKGELDAAMDEARTRWPEFVAAFESREADEDRPFIIKAPFGEGDNVEFMWVEVTALEGDTVFGVLMNAPHAIPGLHEGDRVRVVVDDVCDWLCVANGQPLGGFTVKAIDDTMRRDSDT